MASDEYVLGIDFGTSKCTMAWVDPRTGRADRVRNAEGEEETPSLVYYGEEGVLVGALAAVQLKDSDRRVRVVSSVKRHLADDAPLPVPGYPRPVDVVAELLRKLKHDAEELKFNGAEVRHAVVTCPATFDQLQRDRLLEAAARAGIPETRLLDEPVAAAIAYAHDGLDVGRHVLVYDLGAGTFDLALLTQEGDDQLYRVAMDPDGLSLGGDDFDRALYEYADGRALELLGRSVSLTDRLDLHFLMQCRERKQNLSFEGRCAFSSYLDTAEGGPQPFRFEIDRETFESLIAPDVDRTLDLTRRFLERAGTNGFPVETVVLIGGSSIIPLISSRLAQILPLPPRKWDNRTLAVALGAAYHAHRTWLGGEHLSSAARRPKDGPPPEAASSDEQAAPTPAWAESQIVAARGLLRAQQVDTAARLASDLTTSAADHPCVSLLMAEMHLMRGAFVQAKEAALATWQRQGTPQAAELLALADFYQGAFIDAEAVLRGLTAGAPHDTVALLYLPAAQAEAGLLREAEVSLEAANARALKHDILTAAQAVIEANRPGGYAQVLHVLRQLVSTRNPYAWGAGQRVMARMASRDILGVWPTWFPRGSMPSDAKLDIPLSPVGEADGTWPYATAVSARLGELMENHPHIHPRAGLDAAKLWMASGRLDAAVASAWEYVRPLDQRAVVLLLHSTTRQRWRVFEGDAWVDVPHVLRLGVPADTGARQPIYLVPFDGTTRYEVLVLADAPSGFVLPIDVGSAVLASTQVGSDWVGFSSGNPPTRYLLPYAATQGFGSPRKSLFGVPRLPFRTCGGDEGDLPIPGAYAGDRTESAARVKAAHDEWWQRWRSFMSPDSSSEPDRRAWVRLWSEWRAATLG